MSFVSARATRTAVFVVALSGAGLWALRAMDAKADPPPLEESRPCAEGRALFAAKLAYLEVRIAPEPSQEEAWRTLPMRCEPPSARWTALAPRNLPGHSPLMRDNG